MSIPHSLTAVEFTHLGKINRQMIPVDGMYTMWLSVGIHRWPAVISIGTNSNFVGARGTSRGIRFGSSIVRFVF